MHSLSDDQVALIGCAAALLFSGTLMSLSYFIGRSWHAAERKPRSNGRTVPTAKTVSMRRAPRRDVGSRRDAA